MTRSLDQRGQELATRERALHDAQQRLEARIAQFHAVQSEFHRSSIALRDRLRTAWAEVEARQKRLADEWHATNRYHAAQAAALKAQADELAARQKADHQRRVALERELQALRQEASALEARIVHARQVVEELEQRRAELLAEVVLPPALEEPPEQIPLQRAADRDLEKWSRDLDRREEQLQRERAALQAFAAEVRRDKEELADRRRVLAEQYEQIAHARRQWQEAERSTVAELEQLARSLRQREAELDAREQRLVQADARRRHDAFELWQWRLRLEAWQAQIVASEMRWHNERQQIEADLARRECELAQHYARDAQEGSTTTDDAIPLAFPVPEGMPTTLPSEVTVLREELERLAAVLLEAELPEPPDPPEDQLPFGSEEHTAPRVAHDEPDEDVVTLFDSPSKAA
ncbi:MAG: hypothetical protein RMJ56_10045 [Gemmataceae bacterium]|nr:hypothetical protein [Gemmata sp.]MDW8197931.1 hypothetical protein [Gemmataceae bacterium]